MSGDRIGFARAVAAVVVAVLLAPGVAAAAPRPAKLAAHLQLSATRLHPGDELVADPRKSRRARGVRLRSVTVDFGDGTPRARTRRLALRRHRYKRPGRYVVVLTLRDGRGTKRVARRTVVVGDDLVRAEPRPGTVVADGAGVAAVRGDPRTAQTVVLEASAAAPAVGGVLVLPASREHPDGVLGRVTGRRPTASGGVELTLRPATIDEAYRQLRVEVDGTFGDAGAYVTGAPTARSAAKTSTKFAITKAHLDCRGAGAGPSFTVDLDLSPLNFDLSFTSPFPSIHFLVTGRPKLTTGLGLSATTCTYKGNLKVQIPIPGTPLVLKAAPAFKIGATGTLEATFTWTPALTFGFDKGNGQDSEARVFNPGTTQLGINASAGAELFLGASTELSLGGRVGVGADFGPSFELGLEQSARQSCLVGDLGLKLAVNVNADVFVKSWSFTVLSATVAKKRFLSRCNGAGGSGGGGPPAPAGSARPGGAAAGGSGQSAPLAPAAFSRVSVGPNGAQGNCGSAHGLNISASGRFVAFGSCASNLVAGDTNGGPDLFLSDRSTGATERVSVGTGAAQSDCDSASYRPAVSDDGRFVAFMSCTSTFDGSPEPSATGRWNNVYLRDRVNGTTTSLDRERGSSCSYGSGDRSATGTAIAMTPGGSHVVFPTCGGLHLFHTASGTVTDLLDCGGASTRVSAADISDDGRYVLFTGMTSSIIDCELPWGEPAPRDDGVYLIDRAASTIARVDVATGGAVADCTLGHEHVALSGDASRAAFASCADNLDGAVDQSALFVRDLGPKTTRRVTGDASCHWRSGELSRRGRLLAYQCTMNQVDVMVWDAERGTSRLGAAVRCHLPGEGPALSASGTRVAFGTCATNVVPGDTNGHGDTFTADLSGVAPDA